METPINIEIQRVANEWFVVVPQRLGTPLKFQCESLSDAQRFAKALNKRPSSAASRSAA